MDATNVLRPARPDDALCLGVLGLQVFLDTYATEGIRPTLAREVLSQFDRTAFEAAMARPSSLLWVVERHGHLVGFVQAAWGTRQALVDARRPGEVERLYVQEPFTGQGLGKALLHAAEAAAVAAGVDGLWLSPWVHNRRAIEFYRRQGWQDVGTTWYRFEDESHENRVFVKRLARAADQAPDPSRASSPG